MPETTVRRRKSFPVEFRDLGLQSPQDPDKPLQAGARRLREIGARILDLSDQPLDVRRTLRRDQPVLGEVPAQRVDDLGALADQEIARPETRRRPASPRSSRHERMVGRWAASQIASASAMSFFWRLTNGFT